MTRILRLAAVAVVLAPLAACSNAAPTDPTAPSAARRRLDFQETQQQAPEVSLRLKRTW